MSPRPWAPLGRGVGLSGSPRSGRVGYGAVPRWQRSGGSGHLDLRNIGDEPGAVPPPAGTVHGRGVLAPGLESATRPLFPGCRKQALREPARNAPRVVRKPDPPLRSHRMPAHCPPQGGKDDGGAPHRPSRSARDLVAEAWSPKLASYANAVSNRASSRLQARSADASW